jgi:DNA-binding phage protein
MTIYTIEQIIEALKDRNITVVAQNTGINRMTIYNVINKKSGLNFKTYITLVNYLFGDK